LKDSGAEYRCGLTGGHFNSKTNAESGQNMANGKDKNYVSVWFWLLAMFLMVIPCVGWVLIIVWAFVGENESRKNFFRAKLIWLLIWIAFFGMLMALGLLPVLLQQLQHWAR
jgi:bacteriorhodopsin